MACIDKIYSVSAVIGASACNANCAFCAAKDLRKEAPSKYSNPNLLYWRNYRAAMQLCAKYGGWSLSLTSSGEPTCDPDAVSMALDIYSQCAKQGAYFPNVNLFTNGILLGDDAFCRKWLPKWRNYGLTNIAVSIHDVNPVKQAIVYGVNEYPDLKVIFDNIKFYGIGARATLLLRKGGVDNAKTYSHAVQSIVDAGCHNITSWPIGNPDNTRNAFTPSRLGLWDIKWWLNRNANLCHGHQWGGGVYDWKGNILRLTDYVTPHNPKKNFVRQLVVFQDGTVAYSWIRQGALCMI